MIKLAHYFICILVLLIGLTLDENHVKNEAFHFAWIGYGLYYSTYPIAGMLLRKERHAALTSAGEPSRANAFAARSEGWTDALLPAGRLEFLRSLDPTSTRDHVSLELDLLAFTTEYPGALFSRQESWVAILQPGQMTLVQQSPDGAVYPIRAEYVELIGAYLPFRFIRGEHEIESVLIFHRLVQTKLTPVCHDKDKASVTARLLAWKKHSDSLA